MLRGRSWPSDLAARRRWEERQHAPPTPEWRVLVPAREPIADEMPAAAARAAEHARAAGARVRVTYALAEHAEKGLVHSVAVRVRFFGVARGYAVWRNGYFSDAQWLVPPELPRPIGAREFAVLAAGQLYVAPERPARLPAPVGPCPSCGVPVRWRLTGAAPAPYTSHRCKTRVSS